MVYTRVTYCTEASGGIWRLVVSTNFSSNHSCCCVLFSALEIAHISSCCRQAAVRWGRTLANMSNTVNLIRVVNLLHDRQTVTDRKYALRSVSVRQRSRWLSKAPLNWQDMPTIRTVRTIRTDREPIHDPSQIVRRAVVG